LDRTRREVREPVLFAEVRNRDGPTCVVRLETRSLPELGLQLLEAKRRLARSRDITRLRARRDEGHSRGQDGQDIDDPPHEVIEDRLDREIRRQRAGELAQYLRELFLIRHDSPSLTCSTTVEPRRVHVVTA